MSASGPAHDGPIEQESLEELFGTVIDLAGQIASRISRDQVEARLRRTLWQAGHRQEAVPPGQATRPGQAPKLFCDDLLLVALVSRAAGGDRDAWSVLAERYAPLVWSICARFRLTNQDAEDVAQNVWLLLVEQLGKLRDPAALPGWLATTTRRECLRVNAARKSMRLGDVLDEALRVAGDTAIEEEILIAERNAVLLDAFAGLPRPCQQLLSMLMADPPYSYAEISTKLGIPVGSIGPQRARCLDRLRKSIAPYTLNEGSQVSSRSRLSASFFPIIDMADPEGPARELPPWPTSVPNPPHHPRPTPRCRIPATPRRSAFAPPG